MAELKAGDNPIVVNNTANPPETNGTTKIRYEKQGVGETLWERPPEAGWTEVNVHTRTGLGDEAEYTGEYDITLQPGQSYTAAIYTHNEGPNTPRSVPLATITVFAVLKRPEQRSLVTDERGGSSGGTWLRHGLATNVPTRLVLAGASRSSPQIDDDGLPSLVNPDAAFSEPLGPAEQQLHSFELTPLVPGHHYFLTVMVADKDGNWEVLERELDTLKRKLIVQFPRIHIFNDGDSGSPGDAEFWFRVSAGDGSGARHTLQEFHLPEMDIDDGSNTPYPVGFAYVELEPKTISPDRTSVWVSSSAIEHDGILESDEGAGKLNGKRLPLPVGPSENVTGSSFHMDCPTTTTDDDFHYGVDITFSVTYTA